MVTTRRQSKGAKAVTVSPSSSPGKLISGISTSANTPTETGNGFETSMEPAEFDSINHSSLQSLSAQLASHLLPEPSMAKVLRMCFELLAGQSACVSLSEQVMDFLAALVVNWKYAECVEEAFFATMDRFQSQEVCVGFVLRHVQTVSGLHSAARFLTRVYAGLMENNLTQFVHALLPHLAQVESVSVAFFAVQIFAFLQIRGGGEPVVLGAIAQALGGGPGMAGVAGVSHVHPMPSAPSMPSGSCHVHPPILPAPLFPVSDSSGFKPCPECADTAVPIPLPPTSLLPSLLFECRVCKNIFSANCSQCGSCPLRDAAGSHCWGCGYRALAAMVHPAVAASLDPNLVGILLVCAVLGRGSAPVCFLTRSLLESPPAWLAEEGRRVLIEEGSEFGGTSFPTLPFLPSKEFAYEILVKLTLATKAASLLRGIVKSVLGSVTQTNCRVLVSAGFAALKDAVDPPADLAASLLIRAGEDSKSLNSVLQVVELIAAQDPHPRIFEDLDYLLVSRRMGISSKKLVFKIIAFFFKTPFANQATLTLIEYVWIHETRDGPALKETFQSLLLRHWEDPATVAHMAFTLGELSGVRGAVLQLPTDLVFRLFHEPSLPLEDRLRCVDFILASRLPTTALDDLGFLIRPLVDLAGNEKNGLDREVLFLAIKCLTTLVPLCQRTLFAEPLWHLQEHTLKKLIQTEASPLARAGMILILKISHLLEIPEIIDTIVTLLLPALAGNESLRACWLLGTIVEFEGGRGEIGECVIESAVQQSLVAVLGFVGSHPHLRESLIGRSKFSDLIDREIRAVSISARKRTVNALAAILHSAITAPAVTKPHTRPDGGVSCRSLTRFLPNLLSENCLFSSCPSLVQSSLQCVDLMEQIGIVNPRTLPPVLLARWLVPIGAVSDDSTLQTVDAHVYARQLFERTFEKHRNVTFLLANLAPYLTDQIGVVNIAYRLGDTLHYLKKEEGRVALNFFVHLLLATPNSILLTLIVINAYRICPDESVVDSIRSGQDLVGEDGEEGWLKLVLSEICNKRKIGFENLLDLYARLVGGQEASPDPLPEKKRKRASLPRRAKRAKRLLTEYTSGSSEDE